MRSNESPRPTSVGSAVAVFAATGLAALLVIWVTVVWVARHDSTRAAVLDAQDIAVGESATIAPFLSEGIVNGDRVALAALDEQVRARVMSPRTVRVKIWSTD